MNRAKIVITNYHAFQLREQIELSAGGRSLLQGRVGDELNTQETEGQMLQRARNALSEKGQRRSMLLTRLGYRSVAAQS